MRYGIIKIFHNLPVEHFAMKGMQLLFVSIIRIGHFMAKKFYFLFPLSKQLRKYCHRLAMVDIVFIDFFPKFNFCRSQIAYNRKTSNFIAKFRFCNFN